MVIVITDYKAAILPHYAEYLHANKDISACFDGDGNKQFYAEFMTHCAEVLPTNEAKPVKSDGQNEHTHC